MYSPRLAPRPVTSSQNASKSPRSKSPSQQANFGRMSNVLVIVHTDCQEVQHVLSIGHNNWTRRQRSLSVSFATMIETTILWIFITLLPFHRNGDTKNGASRHPRHFGRVVKAIDSNQLDSSSIGISRAGSNPAGEFERWADRTSNWSDPLTITSWQSSRLFATSSSPEPTPRTSRGNSLISPTPTDSQILAIALAFC
ncbi:hypothetical protein PGTUg99_002973 [Puccinia graminis f. sp. tritici]|uniref:Uncharacterized protein n=1 Tax=Puccinia graminis f. sp. tritici TaxID=56615 RepID=A0A5B0LRW4_PUCGR|nr:hypothetical protein PGTUg99_002973 [Puccinia graminis f. sp. tritici]